MKKFIDKNPWIIAVVMVVLAIVIGAAGYFLLVSPKKASLDKKQKEVESTEQLVETEKNTNKELLGIKNRSAEYEQKYEYLKNVIPSQPDLPQLIRDLQSYADVRTGAGVPWLSFQPGEIANSEGATEYRSYTFSMSVGGYYNQVVELIYMMERSQRAIMIDTVNMSISSGFLDIGFGKNRGVVQGDISARTYTFATETGEPATEKAEPATKE